MVFVNLLVQFIVWIFLDSCSTLQYHVSPTAVQLHLNEIAAVHWIGNYCCWHLPSPPTRVLYNLYNFGVFTVFHTTSALLLTRCLNTSVFSHKKYVLIYKIYTNVNKILSMPTIRLSTETLTAFSNWNTEFSLIFLPLIWVSCDAYKF